ncbi:hypothetical protein [Streptosporangium vulgare]|uniref:SAM-dependent methyltransferase TRM5/TYW2-type domain-containing protein n=1 Tax=Streptosporangium vulgare TaxID=46190 RepID=A0ABV5TA70_9ACTN
MSLIAFEPVPENLTYLRRNVERNELTGCVTVESVAVESMAVGASPGEQSGSDMTSAERRRAVTSASSPTRTSATPARTMRRRTQGAAGSVTGLRSARARR